MKTYFPTNFLLSSIVKLHFWKNGCIYLNFQNCLQIKSRWKPIHSEKTSIWMTSIPQKSDVTQSDGILGRNLCHNRPDESLDSEKVHSRNVMNDTMYHTKCTLSFFFVLFGQWLRGAERSFGKRGNFTCIPDSSFLNV